MTGQFDDRSNNIDKKRIASHQLHFLFKANNITA